MLPGQRVQLGFHRRPDAEAVAAEIGERAAEIPLHLGGRQPHQWFPPLVPDRREEGFRRPPRHRLVKRAGGGTAEFAEPPIPNAVRL